MTRKENLPFIAVLGALAVAFIVVLVWVHSQVSAKGTVSRELKALNEDYATLIRNDASQKHQDAVRKQVEEAKTSFQALKERLLKWWDPDVYNEQASPLQPTLFLGQLQDLRRQIRALADKHTPFPVLLAQGVENMAFPELGTDKDIPPTEVTYDLIKQHSIMRDIMALLIANDVDSINAISWGGKVKGDDLYDKYLVTVQFTCKYPSLARFQSALLNNTKTVVSPFGDLPRNMFVIEDLAYVTEDQKAAKLAAAAAATSSGSGTGSPGTTYPGTTYPGTSANPNRGSGGGRPTGPFSHQPTGPGGTVTRPTGTGSMAAGSRMPGRSTGTTPDTRSGVQPDTTRTQPDIPGRMPAYNILTVQMTIAMVDLSEQVTGEIPALKAEKEKKKTTPSTSGSQGGPEGES
jgi:hypothetical protein